MDVLVMGNCSVEKKKTLRRIERSAVGNSGDVKPVGAGISEL